MNTIKTKHNWHPNFSLEFTNSGLWLRLSLNIPPALAKELSPNNVTKGQYMWVYALKAFIVTDMINKDNLESLHKMLLNNCMTNIRVAKTKVNCNESN